MENKKYDLEKAKEDCRRHEDALEEAQSCMCGHCHECGFDPSEMKAALDEVERLRADFEHLGIDCSAWQRSSERKDARIRELEAELEDVGDCQSIAYMLGGKKKAEENKILIDYIKRLEAAFLGATKEIVYAIHEGRDAPEGEDVYAEKEAREALERIKAGGKDEA